MVTRTGEEVAASGIEAAIVKGSASAGVKSLGWMGSGVRDRLRDRATRRAVGELPNPAADLRGTWENWSDVQIAQLDAFVESPEMSHILVSIATERALRICGKKSDRRLHEILQELIENLRLLVPSLGERERTNFAEGLFQVLDETTSAVIADVVDVDSGVNPKARARLIRVASSVSAASIRNAEALRTLSGLAEFRAFETDLRKAITDLHSSMRLPHAGTTRQVPYHRLFVPPEVRPLEEKPTAGAREDFAQSSNSNLALAEFVGVCQRTVLLGNPGGGKSTSSLKLVFDVASGALAEVPATTPFLVVLRDYADHYANTKMSVVEFLEKLCRAPYSVEPPAGAIEHLLLNGRGFVVFDGLDELLDTSLRRDVVKVVEGFTNRFPLTPILVTSRSVGYEEAALSPELFESVELQDFNDDQVEAYTRKWFSLDESTAADRKQAIADSFLEESRFVSDLRVNPLMLSLMCGIYSSENYIPRNRPDVYEKCALLLFDRWDKQRGIGSALPFDAHVQAAMRSLALWLYPRQEAQMGLPRSELISYMKKYLLEKRFDDEDEAEEAAGQFIDFCKGRAWVLTDVGSELYGFTHRTFLEYFAASQLVRTNNSPSSLQEVLWPKISKAEWSVVAQLAVQILGKNVEDGADDFLELLIKRVDTSNEPERINALRFVASTLEFVVPRPNVLRSIISSALALNGESWSVGEERAQEEKTAPLAALMDASPENRVMVQRILLEQIRVRLELDHLDQPTLSFALFPASYTRLGVGGVRIGPRFLEVREAYREWGGANWTILKDQLELQASHASWVAIEQCRRGLISAQNLVGQFGVRSLFDYRVAGRVTDPPIAYMIVRSWMMKDDPGVRSHLLREVVDVLIDAPVPWLNRTVDYSDLRTVVSRERRSGRSPAGRAEAVERHGPHYLPAVLLFAAPIWEWANGGRDLRRRRRWLAEFVGADSNALRDVRRSFDVLGLQGNARQLMENWLAGEVSFVDESMTT